MDNKLMDAASGVETTNMDWLNLHLMVQGAMYTFTSDYYTYMLVFVIVFGVGSAVTTWGGWELTYWACKPIDGWFGEAGC